MEEWKPVVGYEGLYEVSNIGRVRSMPGKMGAKPRSADGTLKPAVNPYGYHTFILSGRVKPRTKFAHRLVTEAFIGPVPPGKEVNHINGVKIDNRVENLEYVTSRENTLHATRVLKIGIGSAKTLSKLAESDIPKIRTLIANGWRDRKICKLFGVCAKTIYEIRIGIAWTHVPSV